VIKFCAFNEHIQGAGHFREGIECQDFSLSCSESPGRFAKWPGKNNPYAIAVVADGHSDPTCFRSGLGSQFAAEVTKDRIYDFLCAAHKIKKPEREKSIKNALRNQLPKSILAAWIKRVDDHYQRNNFTQDELALLKDSVRLEYESGNIYGAYGTTLVACAAAQDYWFACQIGDGTCTAIMRDGNTCQPIQKDERCGGVFTTSICDDDAAERCRVFYDFTTLPAAVFVATDGLDKSYPDKDNEQHISHFFNTLIQVFKEKGFENGVNELKTALPVLSKKGSEDDISIAGIVVNPLSQGVKP